MSAEQIIIEPQLRTRARDELKIEPASDSILAFIKIGISSLITGAKFFSVSETFTIKDGDIVRISFTVPKSFDSSAYSNTIVFDPIQRQI